MDLEKRYGKGSWALVTGATGGIGEAFCRQLAQIGFNIVLVGRSKESLAESENRVKEANKNIKTMTVQADLGQTMDPKFYQDIYQQLEKIDVSIVVNNAGSGTSSFFEQTEPEEHLTNIRVNAGASAMLTHALINKLLARKDRSAIINVSSTGHNSPLPYLGVYPATKRFLTFFSYSLHDNYSHKIDVQNLTPAWVSTKIAGFIKGPSVITADECVKGSLRNLGYEVACTPAPAHSLIGFIMHTTFRFFYPMWVGVVVSASEKLALRTYMKKNEAAKQQKKND